MSTKRRRDEISTILKEQIRGFSQDLAMDEVGVVVEVGDGIARVFGLQNALSSEILAFPNDVFGMVLNLEEDSVGVALFGASELIQEGDEVTRTGRILETVVGDGLLGRIVDPLGRPKDGRGDIASDQRRKADIKAPGVIMRQPVNVPLQTGLKSVDAMTPIGRGQRELIIGDRRTGKTAIVIDTIINQKGKDVVCVYVAIAQKASTTARVVETLKQHGALDYTVIVVAEANEPAPMQYIAPYAGCAMAEWFMENGRVLHLSGQRCIHRVRRSFQACGVVSRDGASVTAIARA